MEAKVTKFSPKRKSVMSYLFFLFTPLTSALRALSFSLVLLFPLTSLLPSISGLQLIGRELDCRPSDNWRSSKRETRMVDDGRAPLSEPRRDRQTLNGAGRRRREGERLSDW